jgi:hypothetical protein
MEERNNGSKSKKRLEFTLGQSRTSYAAWNRQAEVNLKPHPLHWRWINDDVMPDLTEPEFDIPQWVVVAGVREQIVHPNNYRIEALRGRQVRYLDPRWAPRGAADVVYETLTEREQNICDKRYEKGVDAADRTRRSFPEVSAETVQDWQLTIERRVWTKMEILPDFNARYAANNLPFLHRAATQIALGEGAISICREF